MGTKTKGGQPSFNSTLVQLKGERRNKRLVFRQSFNSTLVQLKVTGRTVKDGRGISFNSTLVQLKEFVFLSKYYIVQKFQFYLSSIKSDFCKRDI